MKRFIMAFMCMTLMVVSYTQTTLFFQGFENAALTCTENWGYTGGVRNSENNRTGSFAARVGRSAESNTLTFNTVNVAGLTGLNLQIYHSVRGGAGPGMDTREGAVILVSLNGTAFTPIGQVSGFGDYNYTYSTNPANAGSASAGCTLFTCPNPINYSVPAGTTTIAVKLVSVVAGSCATFNTNMNVGTAGNYDRTDEGFFIDDVRLTTTSVAIPGIWTGAFNTDWFDCRNWNNNIVPTATTNVTIDQTAVNNCVVGFSGGGSAMCNNISVSSNNGTNNTLTVQNTASLTCGGNMTITKSGGSGNQKVTLLNSATFSCNDLTMTGTSTGAENAQFENEISTSVTAIINGNLINNTGGKLDLSNPPNYGIIHIKGNYTNNGIETDFKQTNSIVHFDGTSNQTINAAGFTEIFSNIVLNKSTGNLTLNTPVDVEQSVTYTSGIMYTSLTNLINFYDNATAGGMSNASFTDGPVRKTGNDAFTFPVGDINFYRLATMTAPSLTSDHVTGQYFKVNPDPMYNVLLKDPTLDHISTCEYWIIDRTGGTSNCNITLSWSSATSCGVTNLADLRVARWNGSMWKDHGNGGTTGTFASGTVITSAPVTSFSPFTLSSISAANPLPIELIAFNANCNEGKIMADWSTASEINNQYFELQGSKDANAYHVLKTIPAAGNSNLFHSYEAVIYNTSRDEYFRLSQVDFDGTSHLFDPVFLNCTTDIKNISASCNGNMIQIMLADNLGSCYLNLLDMGGKCLYAGGFNNSNGEYVLQLPKPAHIASGIYVIHAQDQVNGNFYSCKIFIP